MTIRFTGKRFITIPKPTELPGVSQIAAYKWVRKGKTPAEQAEWNCVIINQAVDEVSGRKLTASCRERINMAARKSVHEYRKIQKKLWCEELISSPSKKSDMWPSGLPESFFHSTNLSRISRPQFRIFSRAAI